MEKLRPGLRGVAERVASSINNGTLLGLGSGSTVAGLLEELSPILVVKGVTLIGVPTSTQIETVATENGISIVPFPGTVDLVIDGADQVDRRLNLIKGGGGALMREKVLMSSAKKVAVVAGEEKFAPKLCTGGVKVPVEVAPFARKSVKAKLSQLGGAAEERLLPKGYPYFTENGNVILDTSFAPVDEPASLEGRVKNIPGVVEVGVFTIKPITVYKIKEGGTFEVLG
ncbi:MAG: ribose 5-phosphate isomerase A [Thaumarchaeota archaeon]|nr:MAG: ribose 5-phosphate isomerase A [Nitrososphaerota archaeon]